MSTKHRILMTVLVVGLGGTVAGFGVFAAFSNTTSNTGNTFQAGSVSLSDNDSNAAMFNSTLHGSATPGDYDRCIRVTYAGTLDTTVKLYTSAITGSGNDLDVTVDKSDTGTEADCGDFGGAGGTVANVFATAPLTTLDNHANWSNGLAVTPIGATEWVQNDAVTFRFRITVADGDQSKTVNSFGVTWEAQNQ
jgi:hypothetical protein